MANDTTCDPLDRLKNTLRARIPGSTDSLLDLEIFNVLDEFFRRTNAWRYEDDITLVEGMMEYEIDPPENSVMVRVMRMWHGDQPMAPYEDDPTQGGTNLSSRGRIQPYKINDEDFGDAAFAPNRVITPSNVLRYAIFFPTYISIDLPPSEQARQHPMRAVLSLSLVPGCVDCGGLDIPEWMHEAYFRAWLDGVQSSMMSQIGKPYSNPVIAEYHGRRFRNQMAFHKQEAERGFRFDVPTWRFPSGGFISGRRR